MMFSPISLKTKTLETFLVCNCHGDTREVSQKKMINNTGFTSHRLSPKKDFYRFCRVCKAPPAGHKPKTKLLEGKKMKKCTIKPVVQLKMAVIEYNP